MPFLAPAFAAVTAFASTALGSIIVNAAIGIGFSLLSGILAPTPPNQNALPSGMRLSVAMGETTPLSFPVGYTATAGSRKYAMSFGNSGEVPNAYRTEVIQLSDLALLGLDGFWAFKQRCTILWGDPPTAQGYPVLEFRQDGVDYMWVKFRTGLETVADPFMTATFGTHPTVPWTSDFIGRGAPHAIVTMLFNRELFKSDPAFLFEPTPTAFYDFRKDSTNGGSGSHRWGDTATYEPTLNPVVIIYNIIRGVYYNGTWIYGGRNLPAFRLPVSSWMAAANECDAPRALAGGGTEPQFRCGTEIDVNVQPIDTIEELMRTCNARMSEIGGIFEILVGAPGAAVYSFTDDNIVISRGQKYASFPGLNETHNAIEATYAEPSKMWVPSAAPPRYNATYEAQDGGRRLATGVNLLAVPYGTQVQQIMLNLVEDDRRWRTHWITLPPDAWILTGTCVVNWTSERNGYLNKKFLVISATGEPGMCQSVVLREIDPADYSWSSDDELPNPIGHLFIVRPASQPVTGFQALPAIIYDADNVPRRPSIQIVYDGNMPDIRAVHVLVRLKSSGAYVFDAEIPFAVPYSNILNGVFLNNTLYEAAAKYIPYTGRPTEFTVYQDVLTPDVKLVAGKDFDPYAGLIGFENLGTDVAGYLEFIGPSLRALVENAQALATRVGEQDIAQQISFQKMGASYTNTVILLENSLVLRIEQLQVSFENALSSAVSLLQVDIDTIEGVQTTQANAITDLNSTMGNFSASGLFRVNTVATESGANATIGLSVAATGTGPTSQAALFLSAIAGGLSRVTIVADQLVVTDGVNFQTPMVFSGGILRLNMANIGTVTAGLLKSADNKFQIDLNNKRISIST